jgi:preprotein translocase subunit YajC
VIPSLFEILLVAQAPAAPAPAGEPMNAFAMMVPMLIIFALFYFMMLRPQKKREQDLRQMVQNLKENDRVVTIGGIYGVVTNVQRDAERVTIRVDETNGTKLKVGMSAIARVLTGEESETGAAASKS